MLAFEFYMEQLDEMYTEYFDSDNMIEKTLYKNIIENLLKEMLRMVKDE